MDNNNDDAVAAARAGAQACLNALRAMEVIANETGHAYYAERELMVSTLIDAAEPLSPYMTGFIAALAEYIDLNLGVGAKPAHYWVPEAAMSEEEVEASRKQSYAASA